MSLGLRTLWTCAWPLLKMFTDGIHAKILFGRQQKNKQHNWSQLVSENPAPKSSRHVLNDTTLQCPHLEIQINIPLLRVIGYSTCVTLYYHLLYHNKTPIHIGQYFWSTEVIHLKVMGSSPILQWKQCYPCLFQLLIPSYLQRIG